MILPTKHIREEYTLLWLGHLLLRDLTYSQSVSSLWERARKRQGDISFDRFVLALDLLFVAGLVSLRDGMIRRVAA